MSEIKLEFKEFKAFEEMAIAIARLTNPGKSVFTAPQLDVHRKVLAQQKYGVDTVKLAVKEDKVVSLKNEVEELKKEVEQLTDMVTEDKPKKGRHKKA